jgi:hypothetical protein
MMVRGLEMLTKDKGVFVVLMSGHIAPYKNTPK